MQKNGKTICIWIGAAVMLIAVLSLALRNREKDKNEVDTQAESPLPAIAESSTASQECGDIPESSTKFTRPSLAPPTKALTTAAEISAVTIEAAAAARKTRAYLPPPTKESSASVEKEPAAEKLPKESTETEESAAEETEVIPTKRQEELKPADDKLIMGVWKLDQDLSPSLDALVASKFGPQYVPEGYSVKFNVRVLMTAEKAYLKASEAEVQGIKDAVHEYLMAVYALSSENASSPLEKAAVLSWVITREGLYASLNADLLNQFSARYQLANQRIYLGNYTTEDDGLDIAYAFSEDSSILSLSDLRTERQEYAAAAEIFKENFGLTPPFSLERIE